MRSLKKGAFQGRARGIHRQQVLYSPYGNVWFLEGGEVRVGMSQGRVGKTSEGRSIKVVQGTKGDLPCGPICSIFLTLESQGYLSWILLCQH